jgi:hypothetical protein
MYGQDFGITVTNAPTSVIKKNGKQFIKNSFLISSPNTEENGFNDDGYPALFATDYEGNAVQLTYAIEQGNGLYINDNDRLNFSIDNNTIKENNNQLHVDTSSLTKCNIDQLGVAQIPNKIEERENTIYPNESYISVNSSGALFLSDSFYNYFWNYVKNEIKNAIKPLIYQNYYGYR